MLARFDPDTQRRLLQMIALGPRLEEFAEALSQVAEAQLPGNRCLVDFQGRPDPDAPDGLTAPVHSSHGEVVGCIHLLGSATGSVEGREVIQTVAALAGLAFDRRRAQEAVLERERLASLTSAINRALTRRLPLESVLHLCAESLVQYLQVAFARIWLLDTSEQMLVLTASAGMYTNLHGRYSRVPFGHLKIGKIALDGRPRLTNRVLQESWVAEKDWAARERLVAFAGYPLISEERVVGVMAMFSRHPLSEHVLEELEAIAGGIAQCIVRSQSDEEIRRLNQELREQLQANQQVVEELRGRELELHRKQMQLVQAAKMASIGELATGIAHELNNPLNNIALFIGNALDKIDQGMHGRALRDPLRDNLLAAEQQIRRATEIIRHLRIFARAETVRQEPVSVNSAIESALSFLREQFRLNGIRVQLTLSNAAPQILGNSIQLEQVFVNLLSNARDAVRQATLRHIEIESGVVGERVQVIVRDSGPGICPEVLPRIFDPFFTTKEVGEGTGLGLSITYGIIRDHGGQISAESQPGKGTSFTIQLPLIGAMSPSAVRSSQEESPV